MSDFTNVRLAASSSLKNVVFPDTFEWENNFKCFFQIVMHKKLVKATRSGTIQRPLRSLWRVENKTISTKIFLRVFLFFSSKLEMRSKLLASVWDLNGTKNFFHGFVDGT